MYIYCQAQLQLQFQLQLQLKLSLALFPSDPTHPATHPPTRTSLNDVSMNLKPILDSVNLSGSTINPMMAYICQAQAKHNYDST